MPITDYLPNPSRLASSLTQGVTSMGAALRTVGGGLVGAAFGGLPGGLAGAATSYLLANCRRGGFVNADGRIREPLVLMRALFSLETTAALLAINITALNSHFKTLSSDAPTPAKPAPLSTIGMLALVLFAATEAMTFVSHPTPADDVPPEAIQGQFVLANVLALSVCLDSFTLQQDDPNVSAESIFRAMAVSPVAIELAIEILSGLADRADAVLRPVYERALAALQQGLGLQAMEPAPPEGAQVDAPDALRPPEADPLAPGQADAEQAGAAGNQLRQRTVQPQETA